MSTEYYDSSAQCAVTATLFHPLDTGLAAESLGFTYLSSCGLWSVLELAWEMVSRISKKKHQISHPAQWDFKLTQVYLVPKLLQP